MYKLYQSILFKNKQTNTDYILSINENNYLCNSTDIIAGSTDGKIYIFEESNNNRDDDDIAYNYINKEQDSNNTNKCNKNNINDKEEKDNYINKNNINDKEEKYNNINNKYNIKDKNIYYNLKHKYISHEEEFDCLENTDIPEGITAITEINTGTTHRTIVSTNERNIKIYNIRDGESTYNKIINNVKDKKNKFYNIFNTNDNAKINSGNNNDKIDNNNIDKIDDNNTNTISNNDNNNNNNTNINNTKLLFSNSISHPYTINTINTDNNFMISSDYLTIKLWNIINYKNITLLDIKPNNHEELEYVITSSKFIYYNNNHINGNINDSRLIDDDGNRLINNNNRITNNSLINNNIIIDNTYSNNNNTLFNYDTSLIGYSTSYGVIAINDLRLSYKSKEVLRFYKNKNGRYHDFLKSISDFKQLNNNIIIARDLNSITAYDIRKNNMNVIKDTNNVLFDYKIFNPTQSFMENIFEDNMVYERFKLDVRNNRIATGTFNSEVVVYEIDNDRKHIIKIDNDNDNINNRIKTVSIRDRSIIVSKNNYLYIFK